jgi:hypothetical protein
LVFQTIEIAQRGEAEAMKAYKDPSFDNRAGQAADAKQKALDQLRSKPPIDPGVAAERQAASAKREAAEREKRAARKAAEQAANDEKAAQAAEAAAAKLAAVKPELTSEERKLARDARYAARKNRR